MEVYLVTISTNFYGHPGEQRIFKSQTVAEHFVTWAKENHPLKDHRYFGIDGPEEFVVEDSF